MKDQLINTFSIVAVDLITDACGAAVASKFPAVGKMVPYVQIYFFRERDLRERFS